MENDEERDENFIKDRNEEEVIMRNIKYMNSLGYSELEIAHALDIPFSKVRNYKWRLDLLP